MAAVKPIPEDYPRVIPYLCVDGGAKALDWYCDAFGATERMRMEGPPGRIAHAEIAFGNAVIMLSDEFADMDVFSPQKYGGTPVGIMVYVEDVDGIFKKAVANGAKSLEDPQDKFYGDRTATVVDPFGHRWFLATHVEDVSAEEMERRAAEQMGG